MFSFLYQFLFVDQKQGHVSHTKFWSNVGYAAMTWAFCWVVYKGHTDIDVMLWALFGAVVVGNRTIHKVMNKGGD